MLNHKGTVTIYTDRLILRRFEITDATDMYNNWASDSEVTRYLSWLPHESQSDTEDILAAWCALYEDAHIYNWAIELKEINQVIGNISLVDRSEKNENCELGYCLSRRYWRSGIMTEAVQAVISFLFNEVGFYRIGAKHDIKNIASGKVMQKSGMQYEGTLHGSVKRRDGTFADLCIYGITRDMVTSG